MGDPAAEATDAVLAARLASGDHDALGTVYRRHRSSVVGLARRVLGDAALAEDVAQTVFVELWRSPRRFDPARGTLRTWLITQAHGRSVDLVRSEERRRRRQDRHASDSSSPRFDDETWDHLQRAEVRRALSDLPPDEMEAIALAYLGGHTYREVARLIGAPEGTVKSRIRSGLGRLRQQLDPGAES